MVTQHPVIRLNNRASHGKRSKQFWLQRLWTIAETLLVRNPLQTSSRLRIAVLRLFGTKIGTDVVIQPVRVMFPWHLEIGDRCWIGEGVWFSSYNDKITLGSDTVISQGTFITTGSHNFQTDMALHTLPVTIGSGVWITSKCVILAGVEIADNVIVTANSVVNRSVLDADTIVGGNPAKYIKDRW